MAMKRTRSELECDAAAAAGGAEGRPRKNVMRNVMVALDVSEGVNKRDFLPDRLSVMVDGVLMFINKYFDACPLGHMGLVVTREMTAERPCRLQVGREAMVAGVKEHVIGSTGSGQGSIQNALQLCVSELSAQPDVATREVLVVWASSSSSDPGNVFDIVQAAKERNIRINVLGFGGKLFVLSKIAAMTGGTYYVPKHETHLHKLLLAHVEAPATLPCQKPSYILMGFPWSKQGGQADALACPRCGTPASALPTLCTTCNITLLSSSHIARSYYSLFQPPAFATEDGGGAADAAPLAASAPRCVACDSAGATCRCAQCGTAVCRDCQTFLEDKLRMCPGC